MVRETDRRPRSPWSWLVAALLVLPCPVWLLLAALGTGGVGGVMTRNRPVLAAAFIAVFAVGLGLTLWRGLAALRRRRAG